MKKLLLILLCLPFIGFGQCISGDCKNGQGTMVVDDWDVYVGEWKNGKFHWKGTYTFADGREIIVSNVSKVILSKPYEAKRILVACDIRMEDNPGIRDLIVSVSNNIARSMCLRKGLAKLLTETR